MIERLYKKNRKKYINIMARILRQDYALAEDVVQEAFCRAWKFRHSYDENRGTVETWFNRILFNSLRDIQGQMKGLAVEMPKDISVESVFPQSTISRNPEMSSLVRERVQSQNNEKHRRVLELFYIMGYTSTEISQIEEKVSVSNVTTIVNRFRNQLVKELKWK